MDNQFGFKFAPAAAVADYILGERAKQEEAAIRQQEIELVRQAAERNAQPQPSQQQVQQEEPQFDFGAQRYEYERQKKLADINKRLDAVNQMVSRDFMLPGGKEYAQYRQEAELKPLLKEKEAIKPFQETPAYKNAEDYAKSKDFAASEKRLRDLREELTSVEELAKTNPKEASVRVQTFLTTLVNQLKGSSDAEQFNEFARRAPEIMSYVQYAEQSGKSPLNPTTLSSYLSRKDTSRGFIDALSADPMAYIEKVKGIHDALATSHINGALDRIVYPTSPIIAERDFGVKPPVLFADLKEQELKKQLQQQEAKVQQAVPAQQNAIDFATGILNDPNKSQAEKQKAGMLLERLKNAGR